MRKERKILRFVPQKLRKSFANGNPRVGGGNGMRVGGGNGMGVGGGNGMGVGGGNGMGVGSEGRGNEKGEGARVGIQRR